LRKRGGKKGGTRGGYKEEIHSDRGDESVQEEKGGRRAVTIGKKSSNRGVAIKENVKENRRGLKANVKREPPRKLPSEKRREGRGGGGEGIVVAPEDRGPERTFPSRET